MHTEARVADLRTMPGQQSQSEFHCQGEDFPVTQAAKDAFQENGYIIVRGLLDQDELGLLKAAIENDSSITGNQIEREDGEGYTSKTCLWNQPADDITGVVMRSEKVAGTWEQLLGREVYIYHIKMTMKEPYTGGAFVWHQDYGYWYLDGCVVPDMGTVYIAIDSATRENGCLQILKGSHKMGRLDTKPLGEQVGADLERVELAHNRFKLVYAELEPGDAMFFHCNILHRSEQNPSPYRRWAYLGAFNTADNSPVFTHHPNAMYCQLDKVPNSAIKPAGLRSVATKNYCTKEMITGTLRLKQDQTC